MKLRIKSQLINVVPPSRNNIRIIKAIEALITQKLLLVNNKIVIYMSQKFCLNGVKLSLK